MRTWLAVCSIGLASQALASGDQVSLNDANGARFEILIPKQASAEEKAAGEELRGYLKRICGAEFAIRSDPSGGPAILVSAASRAKDVSARTLSPDGVHIEVAPKSIRGDVTRDARSYDRDLHRQPPAAASYRGASRSRRRASRILAGTGRRS